MPKTEEYYQSLILDYLSGEADEKQLEELWEWVQAEENHLLLFRQWMKVYYTAQASGQWSSINGGVARKAVFARLKDKKGRHIRRLAWGICVASVAVIFTLTWLGVRVYFQPEETPAEYATIILPPEFKGAILVTGEKETLILSGRDSLSLPSTTGQTIHIANNGLIDYSELHQGKTESTAPQHTLRVPRGSEFCITLSDGSRVWLNAMSQLTYPEFFAGRRREVRLSGEAYFEVARDTAAPFIVQTAEMSLEVLGTSFNVRAYEEENYLTTTLTSGKIQQLYRATGDTLLLAPRQQSLYDKKRHHLQICQADLAAALAWKEGRILVRNGRLEDIFRELNRWYDFNVSYQEESLKGIRFFLNVDRYTDVESVLEKLQRTRGVRFVIRGKEISVHRDK